MEDSPKLWRTGPADTKKPSVTVQSMRLTKLERTSPTIKSLLTVVAQFNRILDPGLITYAKQRQKSNLPDVSVRQAFEHLGWVPDSPIDDLIEWVGVDLDEYATTPEHTSLYGNYPDDTFFDFGNNTIDYFVTDQKDGFVKVVHCLAKDFLSEGDPRLHLGSTVVEVDWTDRERVCVTTRESSTLREYCAPYAILTFSLGVLKSDAVRVRTRLTRGKEKCNRLPRLHPVPEDLFGV